jgi:phosphohistidine phosphatase SixA
VIVYLVRHARAGKRSEWDGDDRLRPLDERGRLQAEALVGQLEARNFSRIVSSPYLRCVESVAPLAQAREVELEQNEALAEGAGPEPALALFNAAAEPLVACVHGDLVEALLGEKAKKGSTTVLDVTGEDVAVLERLEPQA